jgi:hypothetical protein
MMDKVQKPNHSEDNSCPPAQHNLKNKIACLGSMTKNEKDFPKIFAMKINTEENLQGLYPRCILLLVHKLKTDTRLW